MTSDREQEKPACERRLDATAENFNRPGTGYHRVGLTGSTAAGQVDNGPAARPAPA
jgi:hypothetical protein